MRTVTIPIRDVLNGLVWDGTPRIRSWHPSFPGCRPERLCGGNDESISCWGPSAGCFPPAPNTRKCSAWWAGRGPGKSSFFRLLAIRDEWFSDDLKKLDDDRVYLKLQGHWIIEMSEMLATSSAKSIEEIRSFISRQKETYRTPYEAQPKDRLRQCVFGGFFQYAGLPAP